MLLVMHTSGPRSIGIVCDHVPTCYRLKHLELLNYKIASMIFGNGITISLAQRHCSLRMLQLFKQ
jgi:hypothetical protein